MKLKLIVNGSEAPDDYKLLRTTVFTVASLRKTAVLRFTSERLVIVSTPRSSANSGSTILQSDAGQLWCTIPRDLFKLYNVTSARELNTITMEYNCESLISVFKRYDRVMGQGCSSNMTIKLQSMPEWNPGPAPVSSDSGARVNPVCALGITFEEIFHTQSGEYNNNYEGGSANYAASSKSGFGSSKTVLHSFRVPVKLLFKAQDARIQEPMINYAHLMMYKLPPISGEFGAGFHNFIKRVDRYTNVRHIKVNGVRKVNELGNEEVHLKIVVNELDWHLDICWNGPLDSVIQQGIPTQESQEEAQVCGSRAANSNSKSSPAMTQEDSMRIEDSDTIEAHNNNASIRSGDVDVELVDVSAMVERAEQESSEVYEVFLRSKDWKVCHKLYGAFEEVVLAISHNESCILHCSLDRGSLEDGEDLEKPKERGQIIYYIARSKPI